MMMVIALATVFGMVAAGGDLLLNRHDDNLFYLVMLVHVILEEPVEYATLEPLDLIGEHLDTPLQF
jgi:hypothetical protein